MSDDSQNLPSCSKRYDALDGMRGVAALSVMIYHYTRDTSSPLLHSAYLAVDMFFILSGFVITQSYGRRLSNTLSAPEYMRRRLIRLGPMFLISLMIGAPILYFLTQEGSSNYTPRTVLVSLCYNTFFLPYINDLQILNLVGNGVVAGELFPANPPVWSLFFELVASFAFIQMHTFNAQTLSKIIKFSFAAFMINGFLVAFLANYFAVYTGQGWDAKSLLGGFPRVFYGFTLGIALVALSCDEKWTKRFVRLKPYFTNTYILYFALLLILSFPKELKGIYAIVVLLTAAPFLVFMGSQIECKGIEQKIAAFLGWISYPVYCLHYPISRMVFMISSSFLEPIYMKILVSVLVTLAASIVLTKFCEEPIRAYLSRNLLRSGVLTRN